MYIKTDSMVRPQTITEILDLCFMNLPEVNCLLQHDTEYRKKLSEFLQDLQKHGIETTEIADLVLENEGVLSKIVSAIANGMFDCPNFDNEDWQIKVMTKYGNKSQKTFVELNISAEMDRYIKED